MKNVAVIFAGGTGTRMGVKDVPKQFLEVGGKPIIITHLNIFKIIQKLMKYMLYVLNHGLII